MLQLACAPPQRTWEARSPESTALLKKILIPAIDGTSEIAMFGLGELFCLVVETLPSTYIHILLYKIRILSFHKPWDRTYHWDLGGFLTETASPALLNKTCNVCIELLNSLR